MDKRFKNHVRYKSKYLNYEINFPSASLDQASGLKRTIQGKLIANREISERYFDKLIVGFHGYGESAEIQDHRHQLMLINEVLDTKFSVLTIAPQALQAFKRKSRINHTEIQDLEIEKWGHSWMKSSTRDQDMRDNQNYTNSIFEFLKAQGVSWGYLIITGHSQGASHAWRVASWFGCDELIIHAGDIPPELRNQWPKSLRESPPLVVIGRAFDDKVYTEVIFKRDQSDLQKIFQKIQSKCPLDIGLDTQDSKETMRENSKDKKLEIWEGQGDHQWGSEWVDYLRDRFKN